MRRFTLLSFGLIFLLSCKEKRSDKAAEKMQEFVQSISHYARKSDSDFIIIPQNGAELAFNYQDISDGINNAYLAAIDGFGIEELFYNGDLQPDEERLEMLRILKEYKPVLVSEYVKSEGSIQDAVDQNFNEGFLCFPRAAGNYDYVEIPESVPNENADDILKLADAQNYLYLISDENFETKDAYLQAIAETNFDLVIIDLFYQDDPFTDEEIVALKTKANGGKRLVIAYMSIGSAEKYRYYWKSNWGLHHPLWLKRKYDGYDDEFWVKFWKDDWKDIIYGNESSYTKKILNAGFDGAYLDNVEAFYFLYFKD